MGGRSGNPYKLGGGFDAKYGLRLCVPPSLYVEKYVLARCEVFFW